MSENRLGRETSPYLLQHRDNPVHWWAWGPEALAEARATGKPILLSVGYAACHWCHVMAHESFEDGATAAVMNAHFVNIKVDREERPDIDAIYMGALHQLGQQGGWPLTMFLDADARPFWGGTYFPKRTQWGRPGFVDVLQQVARIYREEPEKVAHNAVALVNALAERTPSGSTFDLSDEVLERLIARMTELVDPQSGGIRGAPKFPQWSFFWLLWRGAMRLGNVAARDAVVITLKNICQGGIYDHLGGGFARYSVDADWLVPHFEKMLYDNALLIDLLTEVWRETQEPLFADRIAETIAWLEREMVTAGGGLAASLDADSEGEEGKFYVWSASEITEVLGSEDAALFALVYGVMPGGNFEGHTILNRLAHLDLLSPIEEKRLAGLREKLLARRGSRVRPGFDDKVLADWNGLAIGAIARAGVIFERADWIDLASRAFAFVSVNMAREDGRLWHSARDGRLSALATASDYANMIWGALRLYQATGEPGMLEKGIAWARALDTHYWDAEHGGYFTSAGDTADVIVRLKSVQDDATPAANAVQLGNLLALAAITGDASFTERAEKLFEAFSGDVARSPAGHAALVAAALDRDRLTQIVLTGAATSDAGRLRQVVACTSNPGALEFIQAAKTPHRRLAGFDQNIDYDDNSKAYVCVGPVCGRPCLAPDELKEQLVSAREVKQSVTSFTALKGLMD